MSSDGRRPIRPGRLPMLEPNRVKFKRAGGPSFIDLAGWVPFSRVYPPLVVVKFPAHGGFDHVRAVEQTGCDRRYRTLQIVLPGIGRLIVSGVVKDGAPEREIAVFPIVDGKAAGELVGLENSTPIDWGWLDQLATGKLLLARVQSILCGLGAYAYQTDPQLWGGTDPLLDVWAATWQLCEEVPVAHTRTGLDLRDPTTWRS